jgi:diacylglycerol kinase
MVNLKNKNSFESLKNALSGLIFTFKFHKHFKVELFFTLLALFLSWFFNLTIFEFLLILTAIFLVLITEVLNTCFEELCNYFQPNYDEKIKIMKDVSSTMVLLAVIFSLIIGLIIFGPKMVGYF